VIVKKGVFGECITMVTRKQKKRVTALYKEGKSDLEIATQLGLPKKDVFDIRRKNDSLTKEEKEQIRKTRRNIIIGGIAIASVIGTRIVNYFLNKQSRFQTNSNTQYSLTLEQVRFGKVSLESYLDERFRLMPDVQAAVKSGMLKGFLYKVPKPQLELILTQMFEHIIPNKEDIKLEVRTGLEAYYKPWLKEEFAKIVPGSLHLFGKKVPLYVGFGDSIIYSSVLTTDADITGAIKHELEHIKDWYGGINVGGIYLSFDTTSPKTFGLEFLGNLLELRAHYKELEEAYKELTTTNKMSVSDKYFGDRAIGYLKHWNYIKNNVTTDLERRVSASQLNDLKGIFPSKIGKDIYLSFNLFGEKEEIRVRPLK